MGREKTTTTATAATTTTSTLPRVQVVGSRHCDAAIYSTDDWQRKTTSMALDAGPVQFTSLLDGSQDAPPSDSLPDGTALIEKSPINIGHTTARMIRVTASAPHGDARIVYDSAGFDDLDQRTYTFAGNGVGAVDLDAPAACGLPAGGLVQYNGGFVARAPTCVRIGVEADGQQVASTKFAMAGGQC